MVIINGTAVDAAGQTLTRYLAASDYAAKRIAVERNGEIAPYTQLELRTVRITEENCVALMAGADVICEALDDAEAKAMLVDTVLGRLPRTYLVATSGWPGIWSAPAPPRSCRWPRPSAPTRVWQRRRSFRS